MKVLLIIIGIAVATLGGVIAYRALYLDPHTAFVVTNASVREVPNLWRIIGGLVLLVAGALVAFFAARRSSNFKG